MLRYLNGYFSMSTVPDEQTLTIKISTENGRPLIEHFPVILKEYKQYASCICFVDGDQDQHELITICKEAHKAGLKTCLYTGLEEMSQLNLKLLNELDYVKLGRFDKKYGPLNSPTTNQRMYRKDYSPFGDVEDWIDITYRFWPDKNIL